MYVDTIMPGEIRMKTQISFSTFYGWHSKVSKKFAWKRTTDKILQHLFIIVLVLVLASQSQSIHRVQQPRCLLRHVIGSLLKRSGWDLQRKMNRSVIHIVFKWIDSQFTIQFTINQIDLSLRFMRNPLIVSLNWFVHKLYQYNVFVIQ